jgi:hypothetical protein
MPALYSVWNPHARHYEYYQAAGDEPLGPPDPRHMPRRPALGVAPTSAAWPLPAGARLVGRGPYARGKVAETSARRASGMGDGDWWSSDLRWILGLGSVVVAFMFWSRGGYFR